MQFLPVYKQNIMKRHTGILCKITFLSSNIKYALGKIARETMKLNRTKKFDFGIKWL